MPKHKKKGPLSLQGAVSKPLFRSDVSLPLKVVHRDSVTCSRGLPAYVHPSSIQQLCYIDGSGCQEQSSSIFLQLTNGSDCVLHARLSEAVAPGCVEVDEVQQANLRLCAGETYQFSVFEPSGGATADHGSEEMQDESSNNNTSDDDDAPAPVLPFELTDMDVEVRLLQAASSAQQVQQPVQVDAVQLGGVFSKQCCWQVLAMNEYVVVDLPNVPPLLLRVTATNTLTAEEQQEALGYHCFRGLVTPDTKVFFSAAAEQATGPPQHELGLWQHDRSAAVAQAQQQLSELHVADDYGAASVQPDRSVSVMPVQSRVAASGVGVQLLNATTRAAVPPATNVVHVYTNDGEWFPVKKKLLRPCIALTKAVRDSGNTAPSVNVDIDTLTFDRVLIFLEAHALKRKPPGFAIHLLDDLHKAAAHLGLRSLEDYCSHLKGSKQAAMGVYSFADVQQANATGKVWLLLDGMVLDVGRWLPEHPGGSAIIPAQSLNCDCSRFFEMYHASRESFLYLEEFYIGELVREDMPHVPLGGRQPPSADFLAQLREYTAFRQPMLQYLAQQTPATHLGAGRRMLSGR